MSRTERALNRVLSEITGVQPDRIMTRNPVRCSASASIGATASCVKVWFTLHDDEPAIWTVQPFILDSFDDADPVRALDQASAHLKEALRTVDEMKVRLKLEEPHAD